MKLKDLEIFVVAPPFPGWGGRYWIFPKLTTDTGIVGYGECYASTVGPKAMQAVIEDVFDRHMAGENPENIELMFRRAYSSGFTQRPDPTVMGAFSGLEIACWDILGKARNRPVWALLGGKMNDRIRSYTYLYPEPGQESAEFWVNPDCRRRSRRPLREPGLHGGEVRPRRPLHHPRRPRTRDVRHHPLCRLLQGDPRSGGRPRRPSLRHARPVHHPRRHPPGPRTRALQPALVRRADPARQPAGIRRRRRARSASPSPPANG